MNEGVVKSKHFNWRKWAAEERWNGSRNALLVMTIEHDPSREDGRPYVLSSRLLGHTGFTQGCPTLAKAQERADKVWEGWVHTMGLKISEQWWERERG